MAFNIGSCPGAAGPGAKFPQWTVISSAVEGGTTGVVGKVTNAVSKALVETAAFPNRVYFFTSQQAAQNCINASGGAVSPPLQKIASGGQTAVNTATGAVAGLGKAFSFGGSLFTANFWIRAAEFILGIGLVMVGLAHVAKGTPVGDAAGKALKVAKFL